MIPRAFVGHAALVKSPEPQQPLPILEHKIGEEAEVKHEIEEGNETEADVETEGETASISTRFTQNSKRLDELYEHGRTLRERRHSLQEQAFDSKTYTFKPKILENSGRGRRGSDSKQTFLKLYEDAQEQRQRQQEAAARITRLETPTFTPVTSSHQVPTKLVLDDKTKQERFEKLYKAAMEKQDKIDELNATYTPVECTFEPKTNSEGSKDGYSKARLEELYEEGKRRYVEREEAKIELEQQFSFTPRTNTAFMSRTGLVSSRTVEGHGSTLYPSKADLGRRQRELEEQRQHKEMQGCTFAPITNKRKGRMKRKGKAYLRLYKHAQELREKKEDLIDRMTAQIMQRSSDTQHSKTSGFADEQGDTTPKESVFERLYENGVSKLQMLANNEEVAKIRRKEEEWQENEPECTFTPKISKVAQSLNSDRSALDSFTRLYVDAELRKDKLDYQTQTTQGLNLQCTFHPKINEHSKALVERHNPSSPLNSGGKPRRGSPKAQSKSATNELPSPRAVDEENRWPRKSSNSTELSTTSPFHAPIKVPSTYLPDPYNSKIDYSSSEEEVKDELEENEMRPSIFPSQSKVNYTKTLAEQEAERMRQLAAIFVDDEI